MSLFSRLKSLIKPQPTEQIAGYSKAELKVLFSDPLRACDLQNPSHLTSLADAGIFAYYSSQLLDPLDLARFESLITPRFQQCHTRDFHGLPVFEYANLKKEQRLIVLRSRKEFNGVTIRLVTNDTEFLDAVSGEEFSVPPPWIAFDGYEPSWWGSSMQGAQGSYDDAYFAPYFTHLSESDKQAYFVRYNATSAWIERLRLMYNDT
ncbi:hypothetical protein JRG42_19390 [Pseudomonas granadensis]|nr:hypothetical protein [Pseudomonas granadensis]MBN6806294.1 hypothetical protein [Pseudomonas granadensis]MBN6830873.1 hypothetical protein [Pseudomonas granadensis]MBN6840845.1 hypothetical protein [Pseudomonas granadensis]MBN6867777.1 hypothetical protein [Pseudomonas granadensis]